MDLTRDPVKRGSIAVRTAQRIRRRLKDAADHSQAIALAQSAQLRDEPPTDDPAATAAVDATTPEDPTTAATDTQTVTETAPRTGADTADGPLQGAAAYRLYHRARQVGTDSWLYRWLTKEPEPEVIVIDLRETWTAGPILARIDATLRDLLPATVSSTIVRVGYRLRNRATERPVRVLSVATIVLVLVAITALAVGDASIGPELFVFLAALLLAIRGTQSTRSWSDVTATRWYQWLQTALEPPAPAGPDAENTTYSRSGVASNSADTTAGARPEQRNAANDVPRATNEADQNATPSESDRTDGRGSDAE